MDFILGIETSCDETAVAVVADGREVLSNAISSQIAKHAAYGGVVPELAAREHLLAMDKVLSEALGKAGKTMDELAAVAVTNGPGLMPALLVGVNFARGLAAARKLPLIGVNHFLAHIYGSFLNGMTPLLEDRSRYPMVALVVSGGHTALTLLGADHSARVIGSTLDDAAGEALDKAAKLLGLGYPGGPVIEKAAKRGDPASHAFPRSLMGASGKPLSPENRYNFSFSGVKTSLLNHVESLGGPEKLEGQRLYDVIAAYQQAVVDALVAKTVWAARDFKAATVVLCGGVAMNGLLRESLGAAVGKEALYVCSPREYCADNAAMVAGLAWHAFKAGRHDGLALDAYSRLGEVAEVPFGPN